MHPCVQLEHWQGIPQTLLAQQIVSPGVEAVLVHAGGQAVLSATYDESLLCSLKSIPVSQGRRFQRRWRRWDGTQVLYRNFTILFSSTIDLAQSIAIRFQFRGRCNAVQSAARVGGQSAWIGEPQVPNRPLQRPIRLWRTRTRERPLCPSQAPCPSPCEPANIKAIDFATLNGSARQSARVASDTRRSK